MPEIEIEHDRSEVVRRDDGSVIVQDRYRRGPIAPWTVGLHEVICGTCNESVAERAAEADARIALLEHELGHVREELLSIRSSLVRQNLPMVRWP